MSKNNKGGILAVEDTATPRSTIEDVLKVPADFDREWLRGWQSAGSISKRIFTLSGFSTANLIQEISSRRGGPLKCMAIPVDRGSHSHKYLYQPIQLLKILHCKNIKWDYGQSRVKSLSEEIRELEKERDSQQKRIARDSRSHELRKEGDAIRLQARKPSANSETLYPAGKPLSHEDIIKLSGAAPDSLCGVYFLICDEEIVYVGMSKNMLNRVQSHMSEGLKTFNRIAYFPTMECSAKAVESYYISLFRPRLNAISGMSLNRLLDSKP